MTNTKQDWLDEIFISFEPYRGDDRGSMTEYRITKMRIDEAKQAIAKQIEKEVVEARIDELNKLFDKPSSNSDFYSVPIEWVSKRLAQLKDISTKLGEK